MIFATALYYKFNGDAYIVMKPIQPEVKCASQNLARYPY